MALKPISSSDELEKVEAFYAREFSAAIEPLAAEICLYPTIRYTNIVSAVRAAMECSTRPAVYCGVMEAGDVPDCKDSALVHDAFGRASTLLQRNGVKHLLVAETEPVRDFLLQAGFGAEQVKIHPYIAARSIDQGMVNKRASGPLKVGYLGGTRATRSPELVAKLIIEQAAHQDIRWVVQMDLDFLSKRHGSDLVGGLNRLAASGIIELLPSGIDENRYQDVFRSLDLLVMPYSSRYRVIGSGLLIEAIYAGVIPILPADGHMISLYQELGGSPGRIESLTVASLNRAVQEAVGSYSDRSAMVEAVRQAWQHHPWSSESWASTFGTWLGQGADQPTSGGV